MSEIPKARFLLLEAAKDLERLGLAAHADAIRGVVRMMVRLPLVRPRAPRTAAEVSAPLVAAVKAVAAAYPGEPLRSIGRRFQLDGGRVSEILQGDRG